MAARHEEGRNQKHIFTHGIVGKRLSNNGVEVGRGTVLQEIRPGAGFKTGDISLKEKVGGATVVRLYS